MRNIWRKLWLKSGSLERRLFLLSELVDIGQHGYDVPSAAWRKILKRPSEAEDYINFLRFIRSEEKIYLIDVGANVGLWLAEFLAWFPNTEAIAIEPGSAAFKILSERYKEDSRVRMKKVALSNESKGKGELYVSHDSTLNSLESYNSAFEQYRRARTTVAERVKIERLDDLVTELPEDYFRVLKIDVQGHEIEVVEGAKETLAKIDLVICELSFVNEFIGRLPSFARVTTIMEDAGLYPVIFQEYGKHISNHQLECDVLYVRPEQFCKLYLAGNVI